MERFILPLCSHIEKNIWKDYDNEITNNYNKSKNLSFEDKLLFYPATLYNSIFQNVLINQLIEQEGLRIASLNDLNIDTFSDERTILALKGLHPHDGYVYNIALILNKESEKSTRQGKILLEQVKAKMKGRELQDNLLISLSDLYLEKDISSSSNKLENRLSLRLKEDAIIIPEPKVNGDKSNIRGIPYYAQDNFIIIN